MSNPKRNSKQFVPNHYGTQPRNVDTNKKNMNMKSSEQPDYVPPKG